MKDSRTLVLLLALPAVAIVAVNAYAEAARKAAPNHGVPIAHAVKKVPAPTGSGTQGFDNDTPFRRDGTLGGTVGNRFEVGDTNPPHSVATVEFAAAGNYDTSMVMTIWDVNVGTAMVLKRTLLSGIDETPAAAARFSAMLAPPVVGHNGSFIAGLRNSDYGPCGGDQGLASTCDGVALTQGAGGGGGPLFRAARINFNSGAFVPTINMVNSQGADIAGVNAIFRVTGDNLPVELMQFEVE
jgi:hypothetical protein